MTPHFCQMTQAAQEAAQPERFQDSNSTGGVQILLGLVCPSLPLEVYYSARISMLRKWLHPCPILAVFVPSVVW